MKAPALPNDPFAARPVHAPFVRAEEKNGQIQLRQTPPPTRGARAFLAGHFSMFPFRMVCLDERGTFYWNQIDGERTLGQIEQRLRSHYQMEPAQSRDAVILFTKMLMRRSLIALKLPRQSKPAGNEAGS